MVDVTKRVKQGSSEYATQQIIEKLYALGQLTASDEVFSDEWDGDTTVAPSKNAVYDAIQAITPLTGTITKTLASSGGDFSTMAELQAYIDGNRFYRATLTVNFAAETFTFVDDILEFTLPPEELILFLYGQGSGVTIVEYGGVDEANFLYINGTTWNSEVYVDGIDLVRLFDTETQAYGFYVVRGRLHLEDCVMTDAGIGILAQDGSYISVSGVTINSSDPHPDGALVSLTDVCSIDGYNLAINGPAAPISTQGLLMVNMCKGHLAGAGNEINNCWKGVTAVAMSSIVFFGGISFTANTTNAQPVINKIGYDGSYISDNTAALSFLP